MVTGIEICPSSLSNGSQFETAALASIESVRMAIVIVNFIANPAVPGYGILRAFIAS
jgi:hypothetical protein